MHTDKKGERFGWGVVCWFFAVVVALLVVVLLTWFFVYLWPYRVENWQTIPA